MLGFGPKGIAMARALGEASFKSNPVALSYISKEDSIKILLPSGASVIIPRKSVECLRGLPKVEMKKLRLARDHDCFELPERDIMISAPGLLRDEVFGPLPDSCSGLMNIPDDIDLREFQRAQYKELKKIEARARLKDRRQGSALKQRKSRSRASSHR